MREGSARRFHAIPPVKSVATNSAVCARLFYVTAAVCSTTEMHYCCCPNITYDPTKQPGSYPDTVRLGDCKRWGSWGSRTVPPARSRGRALGQRVYGLFTPRS